MFALLFLSTIARAALVPALPWSADGCAAGYDLCGNLEFCSVGTTTFGFRLPGQTACDAPGPIIRLTRGTRYQITLQNAATSAGETSGTTNLHTHGLHVSGDGNGDDVTRMVKPGMCLSYNWTLPADHIGGTTWYHSHHHGRTEAHVSGGAFGPLIVDDDPAALGMPSDDVAAWATSAAAERLLFVYTSSGVWKSAGYNGAAGAVSTTIPVTVGEWIRLRVLVADPAGTGGTLQIVASNGGCEAHSVAHDGVWRTAVPKTASALSYSLTGASRMDLAVWCGIAGTYSVTMAGTAVTSIVATTGTPSAATPWDPTGAAWTPVRPYYLRDLRSESFDGSLTLQITANSIGGKSWNADVPLSTVAYGSVQEWTLQSTNVHPFHLHLYHMQIVSTTGCGAHEYGEFYDTISTSGSANCVVRFQAISFGGRCVLHCHVLAHEDNGAMGWINVADGPDLGAPADVDEHVCPAVALAW
eukprot:TRINITY_DN968_c1_g1_i8.p1 TRINITY_DN968_c1_g1~~TRINITY_DN968_c1_g1_i8.p1  ORF type:complete len:471 (+),score=91.80 TRINITY_DN968_c1_g1_i8:56-1468(+)